MVQNVDHFGPALREPVLLRLARRDDDRRRGAVESRKEVALPLALFRPWPEIPAHVLVRYFQRRQELEILILHVLRRVRRNAMRRE